MENILGDGNRHSERDLSVLPTFTLGLFYM